MPCKVIVNTDSGNCDRLDIDKLMRMLGCVNSDVETINSLTDWNAVGFDTVVICGGDGTLHNAIEKCGDKQIIYAPCGTLNEAAKTSQKIKSVGIINGEKFSYVCAAGSFTEIGYDAKNGDKKRFKSLAYLPLVLKNYRHCNIKASINADGKNIDGEFTLLMVLKSHRCFGLPFNRSYKKREGLYLLAIRSFGDDNLKNRVKMFFPFFRVFFCGVNNPCEKSNWILIPFEKLSVKLDKPQSFCLDGEKRILNGELTVTEKRLKNEIRVVKTPLLKRKVLFKK